MAQDRSTADAILTEHFRYTPLSVIDDLINGVNTIIFKALTALETGLLAQPPKNLGFTEPKASKSKSASTPPPAALPASEAARAEIENGTHALETLLEAATDKSFDIFELFVLQNIFNIKPELQKHVRLEHYKDIVWPLDDSSENGDSATASTNATSKPQKPADETSLEAITPARLRALREQLRSERELGLILEKEVTSINAVLTQLRALTTTSSNTNETSPLATILSSSSTAHTSSSSSTTTTAATTTTAHPLQPLSTTAEFSTSQLPSLKLLLSTLQSKLALLPTSAADLHDRDIPGSTSDEGRKRYVESVAQRAVRGTLGVQVRGDGALGRGRGVEEVEMLEGIVFGEGEEGNGDESGNEEGE